MKNKKLTALDDVFLQAKIKAMKEAYIPGSIRKKFNIKKDFKNGLIILSLKKPKIESKK